MPGCFFRASEQRLEKTRVVGNATSRNTPAVPRPFPFSRPSPGLHKAQSLGSWNRLAICLGHFSTPEDLHVCAVGWGGVGGGLSRVIFWLLDFIGGVSESIFSLLWPYNLLYSTGNFEMSKNNSFFSHEYVTQNWQPFSRDQVNHMRYYLIMYSYTVSGHMIYYRSRTVVYFCTRDIIFHCNALSLII